MRTIILDLETIPDPELPFEPPPDRPTAFPPPLHHQIVAFGALVLDRREPASLRCLGHHDDGVPRCAVCNWPLAASPEDGCVPGNCSYRPPEGSDEYRRLQERRRRLNDPYRYERDALEQFAALLTGGAELVTWNGRVFDLPVIVARALKHRVPLPEYFRGRGYRYRFSEEGHLDLKDQLSDYDPRGAGSLSTWSRLIGLPAKGDMNGSKVAEKWAAGEQDLVRRYCLEDVVRTAHLWIEWQVLTGRLRHEAADQMIERLDALVAQAQGE